MGRGCAAWQENGAWAKALCGVESDGHGRHGAATAAAGHGVMARDAWERVSGGPRAAAGAKAGA